MYPPPPAPPQANFCCSPRKLVLISGWLDEEEKGIPKTSKILKRKGFLLTKKMEVKHSSALLLLYVLPLKTWATNLKSSNNSCHQKRSSINFRILRTFQDNALFYKFFTLILKVLMISYKMLGNKKQLLTATTYKNRWKCLMNNG